MNKLHGHPSNISRLQVLKFYVIVHANSMI
jgi:hypothetical protein